MLGGVEGPFGPGSAGFALDTSCAPWRAGDVDDVGEEVLGQMALRIYGVAIEMVRVVAGFARQIEPRDPDLARQLRRASSSVPLNLNEGLHSQGRNREARLFNAMGSAKETLACVDVAAALGYVSEQAAATERDRLDRIVATLWKLIHRSRR
ncbi:MAG TPA: four helix bundle protein [Nannocystaceae bacterium]|nr:four helix bundle protein [Nannocystaceae bacterium]